MSLKCVWRHLLVQVIQDPHISPTGNDSHPDGYLFIMLCVEIRWFGFVLIDSYQLIESVIAHLPGHKQLSTIKIFQKLDG